MSQAQLRLACFLAVLGAMLSAETWAPKRAWADPRWKRLAFHLGVSLGNTLLTRFAVAAPLVLLIGWTAERGWGLARLIGLSGPAEILATLALFDCYDYWWHRCNHGLPFLWQIGRASCRERVYVLV